MQLFYDASINSQTQVVELGPEESKHITKVLRKTAGEILTLTNGHGYLFKGKLISVGPKKCLAEIIEKTPCPAPLYQLHMAVAPTKLNDRYEWFLEKALEIGVHQITPIICERSERKVVNMQRFEKVLLAAMKQSLQSYLPKLNPAIPFKKFMEQEKKGAQFIAHCEQGTKHFLKDRLMDAKDITVLIGPEGDFSTPEIKLALENGYEPITLGKNRLRTETAAIMACASIATVLGQDA